MDRAGKAAIDAANSEYAGIYQRIRSALEPHRVYSVSLHDDTGEPVWLSESALGPDEHRAVVDALATFAAMSERVTDYCGLGNSRTAVTLRAENAYSRELLGAVLLVVDTPAAMKFAKTESELLTPTLQRAVHEFAATRRSRREPVPPPDATREPPRADAPPPEPQSAPQPAPQAASEPPPADAAADTAADVHGVVAERTDSAVDPELDRLNANLRNSPIELHVQRLVPLRPDTERRRYEVLLRSRASLMQNAAPRTMLKTAIANGLGSMIDRRVLTELASWLTRHPAVWQVHGLAFSVNLTRTSLHDPNFVRFVDLCMAKASLPRNTISFEIDIPTALRAKGWMPDFAAALNALGCPLILDDFVSHNECFALMQLPGVCMIKLSADITARSRADRIAKASLAALVQRARSQHILTVAKRTRSRADEQWLTDLGFDFVQSHAFSLPVTIGSLVKRFGTNATQA